VRERERKVSVSCVAFDQKNVLVSDGGQLRRSRRRISVKRERERVDSTLNEEYEEEVDWLSERKEAYE
jgi:hypothetical protein